MSTMIKYDLWGAQKAGIKDHPEIDVEKMGMMLFAYQSSTLGNYIMMDVEDVPETLPDYITISNHKDTFIAR